jgi:hypothetical protein
MAYVLVLETKFWEFESPLGHHIRKNGRVVYCRCFESRSAGCSPARGFESYFFRPVQFLEGCPSGLWARLGKAMVVAIRCKSSNLFPSANIGSVPERSNGAASKADGRINAAREFESRRFLQLTASVAQWTER